MSFRFTESVAATRVVMCERCRADIQPGEARHLVADVSDKSKYVCRDCHLHYERKYAEALRNTSLNESGQRAGSTVAMQPPARLEVQNIRRDVNESQRRGGHVPGGRVTAMPLAVTPTVSHPRFHSTAPSIESFGYSSAHSQHSEQTKLWSQRAYRGLTANQVGVVPISLEVYQPHTNPNGKPIIVSKIKEGLRVNSDIITQDLCDAIRNILKQPIEAFCRGVPFNIDEMVLRETTGGEWFQVNSNGSEFTPYFETRFIKAPRRKKDVTPVFVAPAKPPVFGLVFEEKVWNKIEALEDDEILSPYRQLGPTAGLLAGFNLRPKRKASHSPTPSLKGGKSTTKKLARKTRTINPRSRRKSISDPIKIPSSGDENEGMIRREAHASDSERDLEEGNSTRGGDQRPDEGDTENSMEETHLEEDELTDDNEQTNWANQDHGSDSEEDELTGYNEQANWAAQDHSPAMTTRSSKSTRLVSGSTHEAAIRDIPATTTIASQARKNQAYRSFTQFNAESIRHGIQRGGLSSQRRNLATNSFVSEPIIFLELPTPGFEELITTLDQFMDQMLAPDVDRFMAHLQYDSDTKPENYLGIGSFKTAAAAKLIFDASHIPLTGLGVKVNARTVAVAMKRPFRTKKNGGMVRLAYAEEERAVFDEAKILVWASALLNLAYEFIAAEIDKQVARGSPPPTFDIPEFHFVAAGIAIAQKPVVAGTTSSGTNRAVYLLEERLSGEKSDFVKYLHNASARSDLDTNDPDYPLAKFLEFLQHVQYQITHAVAYVSDFQGVGTLLTDPQIMTSPTLGNNLFGDGNLGDAFEQFPAQHECNKYCHWFKLGKVGNEPSHKKSKGKRRELVPSHHQSRSSRSTKSTT